jgi:hypothetical protein
MPEDRDSQDHAAPFRQAISTMRYLVTARVNPGREGALLSAIENRSLGAGIGVALGVAMGNIPVGIAIGMGVGIAIGSVMTVSQHDKESAQNDNGSDNNNEDKP